ncbi:MAG: type II toxin-antitoxin system VapC family toxin [Rhodospirillaceae bacterium]|nr:type II toxin-antitoxin system VapC family toxin [Rhodospirillaceae bacterium]MBT4487557.1 type II toxin-antitoxin system VapC family toxin [Rhodospirillaceae bacterium]MBT5191218.1 type II toxin-antitoxin system VapC family toxin [Rhodospirillaceae bacterium]MBT5899237.1 type II toxin-antitoxin system VapC family toxin [Rhodospirillaceae bacterium]MBT6428459.1 type II toxin-antitoxin system VapC family toxin [Rhodospirillaceae bacterium]
MSAFVLDCSIAAAWLFEDEARPETDNLLEILASDGALVPNLWHLEVGNVLVQAEKRGRITAAQISTRLELLSSLPIDTDTETGPRAFREILTLARAQTLTTYDAAYLELAIRRGIPLATQDKALVRAAKAAEVRTFPT